MNGKLGISPKSVQRAKERIRQITGRNRGISFVQVIVELNLFLIGWFTYYRYAAWDSAEAAPLSSQTTQAGTLDRHVSPATRSIRVTA